MPCALNSHRRSFFINANSDVPPCIKNLFWKIFLNFINFSIGVWPTHGYQKYVCTKFQLSRAKIWPFFKKCGIFAYDYYNCNTVLRLLLAVKKCIKSMTHSVVVTIYKFLLWKTTITKVRNTKIEWVASRKIKIIYLLSYKILFKFSRLGL